MTTTGAGGLERKTFPSFRQKSNSGEHDPAGGDCGSVGIEGREAAGDFIGVHELGYAKMAREKVCRRGRLAGAIRSTDDDHLFHIDYAAKSATTASSTGKPAGVTRKDPSPPLSTKPSAASDAMRSGSSGRPASAR